MTALDRMAGMVTPLVWEESPSTSLDCLIHCKFGLYQITEEFVLFVGHSTTGDKFFTLEAAKAAAQSDYTARILAAVPMLAEVIGALADIADPKRLASHGDPTVLRDHARAILAKLETKP